jgi:hypothetical protein
MQAQTRQELLLPEPVNIKGVVSDAQGRPVADARIDHSGDVRRTYKTGSDGGFELTTQAPAIVVRKAGFRSELVRWRNATEVHITLQPASGIVRFPICSDGGHYAGIEGWNALFRFTSIPEVKANPQGGDIDYGARTYDLDTGTGTKRITHGSGPLWGFGFPLDELVWKSVRYDEAAFSAPGATAAGVTILDARGQFANGNRWRYLGRFGESAVYWDADEGAAKILDRFLDGACLKIPTLK